MVRLVGNRLYSYPDLRLGAVDWRIYDLWPQRHYPPPACGAVVCRRDGLRQPERLRHYPDWTRHLPWGRGRDPRGGRCWLCGRVPAEGGCMGLSAPARDDRELL